MKPVEKYHYLPKFFLFIALVLYSNVTAQNLKATIWIDASSNHGPVNKFVFGNHTLGYQYGVTQYATSEYSDRAGGIWDPEKKITVPEMLELEKLAGITVLRYPGGPAVSFNNWKATIGPIEKRPHQKFGLPEFLQHCTDLRAVPMISVPEYNFTAQDAADLVEYLNSPDDGKHPWAQKRTLDGHSQPWNVVWFEYGNETNLGDGRGHKMTAEEYGANYLTYQKAMKAVDPKIQLGAVICTYFIDINNWAPDVLKCLGTKIDFAIDHCYIPDYNRNDGIPNAQNLFKITLASYSQIENHYNELNVLLHKINPNSRIPIAVTEFNGHFVQKKPIDYRFTLGNALLNAEMIEIFMKPDHNIIMANSWQFANEAFGAVRGYTYKGEIIVKRPLYYIFQMYHEHFGNELLQSKEQCDTYETEGGYTVAAAKGKGQEYQLLPENVQLPSKWELSFGSNFSHHLDGKTLVVDFNGSDVNYYHGSMRFAAEPQMGYRATAWIKTDSISSAPGVCLSMIDSRGWDATHSSASSVAVWGTRDWQQVVVDYASLADTKSINIQARRVNGAGPISGRAYIRDVKVQKFLPQVFPAAPYLSVNASRTVESGKIKVYLMVINKHMTDNLATNINVQGLIPTKAKAWFLNGPSVDATNELDPNTVSVQVKDLGAVTNGFIVSFPPHSLTALEIE